MRIKLRLELDCFSLDVPDDEHFVISCLGDHIGVNGAPADSSDVFVRKS